MSRAPIVTGHIATIELTRGYIAVIDACDVPLVEGRNWSALVSKRRGAVYACRVERGKMLLMHRVISGAETGEEIDHRDGNGLNNTRDNLRRCSRRENTRNGPVRKDNRAGLKGAIWDSRANKWRSQITVAGRCIHLGMHNTPEAAHSAYMAAAHRHFGEFARRA